jgi:hypothetical protein
MKNDVLANRIGASAKSIGAALQQTFNEISSELPLGTPIADISMGWDGTLWSIDTNGTPHSYDPIAETWQVYGQSLDAAAFLNGSVLYFLGESFFQDDGNHPAPQPISSLTNVPSFQLGIHGAANVGGKLYLFRSGLFVQANSSQPAKPLTGLKNWPQTDNWKDGVIDTVGSGSGVDCEVVFIRGQEVLVADLSLEEVIWGPKPLGAGFGNGVLSLVSKGVDALLYDMSVGDASSGLMIFKGPACWTAIGTFDADPSAAYVGATQNWPQEWHPSFSHSPSGRVGNLWAAMSSRGGVVYHDGDQWNAIDGVATYASVGHDDSVFTIGNDYSLYRWTGGTAFQKLTTHTAQMTQLSVADQNTVWTRDTNKDVCYYDGNQSLVQSTSVGPSVSISSNYDCTVWYCNADPNVYRFPGGSAQSDSLAVCQGSVNKVASVGYGASYCLTQQPGGTQQIYSYDSPYVMKTVPRYVDISLRIEQGMGRLFFVDVVYDSAVPGSAIQSYVVAIDTHTGQELWRTKASPAENVLNTSPVYDPVRQCVYVGSAPADLTDSTSQGWIIAIDALTGKIQWASSSPATSCPSKTIGGIDAIPQLQGSKLCFGDRFGYVHCFDVSSPSHAAVWSTPATRLNLAYPLRISSPVMSDSKVYWWIWQPGTIQLFFCSVFDGSFSPVWTRPYSVQTPITDPKDVPLGPPVLGLIGPVGGDLAQAVFIQALNEIHAFSLETNDELGYTPPGGETFSSGMSYQDGVLWICDNAGQLWGFDSSLTPVPNTPARFPGAVSPWALPAPVVYKDSAGQKTIFVATNNMELSAFSPETGTFVSAPISQTIAGSLSASVTEGVLYVGGSGYVETPPEAQIFGIRVDGLVSGTHDFIIESQLMQDYDDPPAGQTVPPTIARYQTNLTVVDNVKAPRPRMAIKIWADEPNTAITVDNQLYTVGPDDASFASVQSGVDGTLTITSDAVDMSAVPLRFWAGFMDTYERVVVYPDREFHQRVMTAHATANDDDPDKINLVTATTYDKTPLFNADQKKSGQPAQIASAIQSMGKAVGMGGNPTLTHSLFASPPSKYTPYSDLSGQSYFPVNTPAHRAILLASPAGSHLSVDGQGNGSFAAIPPGEAASRIDAWTDAAWGPDDELGRAQLGNIFSDFWNWLTKTAREIQDIVVSVAEDVYIGIRVIVNGVLKVFKTVLRTLGDAVRAVGAFFVKLGQDIVNAVEALGILFNFGEIMQTHVAIRNEINARALQLVASIQSTVIPDLNTYFLNGECTIAGWIDSLKAKVQGKSPSDLQGAGATEHTVYTVGPKDKSKPGSSHAVQCGWATRKLKTHCKSATTQDVNATLGDLPQPIADFINTFVSRVSDDGDLNQALSDVKADFKRLLHPSSASEFLTDALDTLLDALKVLLEGALAISNAFIDGLLKVFSDLVVALVGADGTGGILNTTLHIPVLSWLYHEVFGEDLTFLNLITMVAAIPITILYRVFDGQYPSKDIQAATGALVGMFGGLCNIVGGVVSAISDSFGTESAPSIIAKISVAIGFLTSVAAFPLATMTSPGPLDWAAWGATIVGQLVLNIFGALSPSEGPLNQVLTFVLPVVLSLMSIAILSIVIDQLVNDTNPDFNTEFSMGLNIASTVPGILNPFKLTGAADLDIGPIVVACLDGLMGFVVGGLQIPLAIASAAPQEHAAMALA